MPHRALPSRRILALAVLALPLAGGALASVPSGGRGMGRSDAPVAAVPVQFRGDAAHTGVLETRGLAGYGGILWRATLPGPVRSTPAVDGGVVYVGSAGGFLHALDRRDGRELWRYRAGAAVHGSPAVAGRVVYVTDMEGTLHAVDRTSGVGVWRLRGGATLPWPWGHESGDVFASSPALAAVDGSLRVFWGGADGVLRAADATTGKVLWADSTGGRIRSTPAVAEGRVVVGSTDGVVYCVDARTGASLWRYATRGADFDSGAFGFDRRSVQSSPAVAGGRVFVGARDGWVYALDLATGARVWDFDHDVSWINGSPAVARGRVFSSSSDARFIDALDTGSGRELWRVETGNIVWTSPVVVDSTVYFSGGDGVVRALATRDGSERWRAVLPAPSHGSPVVDDGVLFVGTEDGGFYALRDGGARAFPRAVFSDSTTRAAGWYRGEADAVALLSRAGYEVLDTAGLTRWLEARVAAPPGAEPGSVVFAQSWLPPSVREGGADALLRRYLDVGGTVVWVSMPPDAWRRDPSTGAAGGLDQVSWTRPEALLGISFEGAIFDRSGAWSTEAGRSLGLPDAWISTWDVPARAGLEPLAVDENGAYAAFRKSYGGAPGTGFVRMWGSTGPTPVPWTLLVAAEWRPLAGDATSPAP